MDTLKNLAAFVKVAQSGSFTAAAAELGVTTPTVSKAVAALERRVDAQLLYRTTRRVSLTADGRTFLEAATAALGRIDQAVDGLHEAHRTPSGQARLWASAAIGKDHVLPLLREFMRLHPGVSVEICFDDHVPDLAISGYDLSVQYSARKDKSCVVKRLGQLPLAAVASPRYLSEYGLPKRPEDLASHQCIVTRFASGHPTVWSFIHHDLGSGNPGTKARGRAVRIVPRGRLTVVEQFDAVLEAALEGLGITVIFAHSALRYLRSGELTLLLPDWRIVGDEMETSVFLCYPRHEYLPYRTRALAEFIVQWFRDPQHVRFDAHAWASNARDDPHAGPRSAEPARGGARGRALPPS